MSEEPFRSDVSTSCWTTPILCVTMDSLGSQLSDSLIQKLFRIFLLFTEESGLEEDGSVESSSVLKHHIHLEEVQFIFSLVAQQISPIHAAYDLALTETLTAHDSGLMTFKEFIQLTGEIFPSRITLEPAVAHVYDQLVNQLLKKVCRKHTTSFLA